MPKAPTPQKAEIEGLARELHVVKGTQIQMAQALQQNTKAFADAFQMADCHLHILQRAMNDLLLDRIYRNGEGGVDFAEYLSEYWATMGFISFVEGLKEFSQPAAEETLIANPDEEVIVFGGS